MKADVGPLGMAKSTIKRWGKRLRPRWAAEISPRQECLASRMCDIPCTMISLGCLWNRWTTTTRSRSSRCVMVEHPWWTVFSAWEDPEGLTRHANGHEDKDEPHTLQNPIPWACGMGGPCRLGLVCIDRRRAFRG